MLKFDNYIRLENSVVSDCKIRPPRLVTMKDILVDICCLKMFLLHLQDLKTWGCYGWIVTLQEFLEMKVDEAIDPLNAILLNFDNKFRRSWYIII